MNTKIIKNIPFTSSLFDKIRFWLRDNISPQWDLSFSDNELDDFNNSANFQGAGWKLIIRISDDYASGEAIVQIEDDVMAVTFALVVGGL